MKILLLPTFYNIVLFSFTAFVVAVVLSPQDSLAFEHDLGSSSSSSSSSFNTYHPYNYGNVIVSALLVRGGSEGDLNLIDDDDNDGHGDHTYTNIAGIQMDDAFRGGGQHQHRDTSTTITSRRTGGFVRPNNNLVGRVRRLSNVRSNVNQAFNNYLVRFYWSQVTKGCSLHILDNSSPSDTDTLLAVQVRGGADNHNKNNQNVSHVNEFTKGIYKILKNIISSCISLWLLWLLWLFFKGLFKGP